MGGTLLMRYLYQITDLERKSKNLPTKMTQRRNQGNADDRKNHNFEGAEQDWEQEQEQMETTGRFISSGPRCSATRAVSERVNRAP